MLRVPRRIGLLIALGMTLLPMDVLAAQVEGRVRVGVEGVQIADVAPVVVFLEGVAGPLAYEPPAKSPTIRQRNALFSPGFLAVSAGQTIQVANDDTIYHNVFSYSRPNDFDLGSFPAAESRSVLLTQPGVVKIYCAIHEMMAATVFVANSPFLAVTDRSGRFKIRGVPPGRYRLRTWSERFPEAAREVTVSDGGAPLLVTLAGAAAPEPGARSSRIQSEPVSDAIASSSRPGSK